MAAYCPPYYSMLRENQEVVCWNLKSDEGRERLWSELGDTDLLVTSSRPSALERLGLAWHALHGQFPRLCQVAIVGYPPPRENEPGHDLTYQAKIGLVAPPALPRTVIADLAGAERAVAEALGLLLARERGQGAGYRQVALSEAAETFARPWQLGLTTPQSIIGGALAEYGIYMAADGWVAVAALEPHFRKTLLQQLSCPLGDAAALQARFAEKTAGEWEAWAKERDLPLVAVHESPL